MVVLKSFHCLEKVLIFTPNGAFDKVRPSYVQFFLNNGDNPPAIEIDLALVVLPLNHPFQRPPSFPSANSGLPIVRPVIKLVQFLCIRCLIEGCGIRDQGNLSRRKL